MIPATPEQEPILANLLELYAHDFSEFFDVELGEDGRFGYKHLPLYWSEPDRHPFLVRVDGKLAGLVLVKRGVGILTTETVWDMAEFFVVRGHRRRGIGAHIAHEIWGRFPGLWEVRVMEANQSAHPFWERTVSEFAREAVRHVSVTKDGKHWRIFPFQSAAKIGAA